MPAVLVDIDDTLADTQTQLLGYVNARASRRYAFNELTNEFRQGIGPGKEYDDLVTFAMRDPALIARAEPFDGALEAMKKLKEAGHEVHIASSRREILHGITKDWLKRHGFIKYIDGIHPRSSDKGGGEFKIFTARKLGTAAAFDDTYEVAAALAAEGVKVYLIEKPWNRLEPLLPNMELAAGFDAAVDDFLLTCPV